MEPTAAFVLITILVLLAAGTAIVYGRRPRRGGGAAEGATRQAVQLSEREREVQQLRSELAEARRDREITFEALADAREKLAAAEAAQKARTEELDRARAQLDNQFKGLAAGVLKDSTETLLRQAKEQFDNHRQLSAAELEQRKEAIDGLVGPIRESLEKLGEHANSIEQKRVGAYEGLTSQIASLQKIAGSLSEALRSPNIRGQWAEQELGNILELSGLHQHIDYYPQYTVETAGSRLRPDAVVKVPGGLKVVIDAKAPLENYLKAHEAADDRQEHELLTNHATAISRHAKILGERDYSDAVAGSPDFVLMFVPADPILDSAMKVQPTLWERAWQEHRVLIATPGLLLAFLRTVALAWQQQDMQKNAQEVADLGKELHDRLRVFAEHINDMGAGLSRALVAYNRGVGSFDSRVRPQAQRFEKLGAVSGTKHLPALRPLEGAIRTIGEPGEPEIETPEEPDASLGEWVQGSVGFTTDDGATAEADTSPASPDGVMPHRRSA